MQWRERDHGLRDSVDRARARHDDRYDLMRDIADDIDAARGALRLAEIKEARALRWLQFCRAARSTHPTIRLAIAELRAAREAVGEASTGLQWQAAARDIHR